MTKNETLQVADLLERVARLEAAQKQVSELVATKTLRVERVEIEGPAGGQGVLTIRAAHSTPAITLTSDSVGAEVAVSAGPRSAVWVHATTENAFGTTSLVPTAEVVVFDAHEQVQLDRLASSR